MTTLADPLSLAWLDWMDGSRIPAHTVARRRVVLRGLGNAGTATRGDVETWWTSRAHLSAATRANDLACLRAFYRWCARWEHRDDDPTRRLDPPRTPRGQPRPMPYDDLWAVLDWCDAHGHHDMRRAVALGAYAGLRVSEVAELEWGDVEWFGARARARIVGKGGKPRIVDLSPALVDMLGPDRGGNVVTGESVAWDGARLQRRVNRLIRAAGVKRATFHSLRHRYGTMAYQASGDLVAVGGQMGHASITTTAIYAAAASDAGAKLADAVAAANAPRVEPLRAARVTHVTAVPLASN